MMGLVSLLTMAGMVAEGYPLLHEQKRECCSWQVQHKQDVGGSMKENRLLADGYRPVCDSPDVKKKGKI